MSELGKTAEDVVSALALAFLERTLAKGETVEIPSLGIVINGEETVKEPNWKAEAKFQEERAVRAEYMLKRAEAAARVPDVVIDGYVNYVNLSKLIGNPVMPFSHWLAEGDKEP